MEYSEGLRQTNKGEYSICVALDFVDPGLTGVDVDAGVGTDAVVVVGVIRMMIIIITIADAAMDAAMDAVVDAAIRIYVQELEGGLTGKGLEMGTGPAIMMLPGAEEDRTEEAAVDVVWTADSRPAADLNFIILRA